MLKVILLIFICFKNSIPSRYQMMGRDQPLISFKLGLIQSKHIGDYMSKKKKFKEIEVDELPVMSGIKITDTIIQLQN